MSVASICHVCEANAAEYTCGQCGRAVCSRHFDTTAGRCVDCTATAPGGRRDGSSRNTDDELQF